jgi:hypothetical protein
MLTAVVNDHRLRVLLAHTPAATLVHIAQEFGLPRVPGLSQTQWVERLLAAVPHDKLYDSLIALRYGVFGLDELLNKLLDGIPYNKVPISRPRMDRIDPQAVVVVAHTTTRWAFTMRGHDVLLDVRTHQLGCDCRHFEFASRYGAICKHIATAFRVIPAAYARAAIIDLLIEREFGPAERSWAFLAL